MSHWRDLSGLTLESEKSLEGPARRAALRKLHAAAESEIRAELKTADEDAEFKGERTFLWEPIPAVCRRLEISQSALTRLLKELTGMSAPQLADKIRAEGIREKIKAEMTAFVQSLNMTPGKPDTLVESQLQIFRDRLKARRANPSFSQATRAIAMGFANYTRYYRACLLQYGLTPGQLEDEVLKEIAEYFEVAIDLLRRRDAGHYINQGLKGYDKHRKPYSDDWAQATQKRPEWLSENQKRFGLSEKAVPWL